MNRDVRGWKNSIESFDERHVQGPQAVTSNGITDLAVDWIDAHAEQPFFLFLHYFDPHYAYTNHEDFSFESDGYEG